MNFTLIFSFFPLLLCIHLLLQEHRKYKNAEQINYLTIILSFSVILTSSAAILLILLGVEQ